MYPYHPNCARWIFRSDQPNQRSRRTKSQSTSSYTQKERSSCLKPQFKKNEPEWSGASSWDWRHLPCCSAPGTFSSRNSKFAHIAAAATPSVSWRKRVLHNPGGFAVQSNLSARGWRRAHDQCAPIRDPL